MPFQFLVLRGVAPGTMSYSPQHPCCTPRPEAARPRGEGMRGRHGPILLMQIGGGGALAA